MEGAMPNGDNPHPNYPLVEGVLNAIADWVNKYRAAVGAHAAHGQCAPDEVRQTAKDLGVAPNQMRALMNKGPGAADLLGKLLLALHVDPQQIAKANPAVMRDLQRLCITCANKKQCAHELAQGTAAEHFHNYCPNAFTLDALFAAKDRPTRH
jgi:hypothetical protein